jgi:histidinol dehydrogenase
MLMRQIDLRGKRLSKTELKRTMPRGNFSISDAILKIEPILRRVEKGTEADLLQISEELDGVRPSTIRVSEADLDRALSNLDAKTRAALEEAIRRIRKVHKDQVPKETKTKVAKGGKVTRTWIAVDRVGTYAPGGLATYPSSVIMNVVPAQIAGVKSIAIASPPQKKNGGLPDEIVMATARLLGVKEVFAVGGAQAVAMFAYGIPGLCDSADIVTGPGNIYVAAAKRALRGLIGIDSEAGPTEIMVLADKDANPAHVVVDLISQAEHDELAAALLVTDSLELASKVQQEIDRRSSSTKHSNRIRASLSGQQSGIVLVDSIDQGLDVINAYAPEHLELLVKNPNQVASRVRNAGAIFLGTFAPVSLGDYAAGSNHVLPTGGCACHSSALSVNTFLRNVSQIEYNEKALTKIADQVITLANAENLPAHGEAISARFE